MIRAAFYLCLVYSLIGAGIAQQPASAPPQPPAATATAAPPAASVEQVWADLMTGNRRFVAGKPQARDLIALRRGLASDQHPRVIVLACSDSRVAPELVFDQSLGDLFVVRAAGNVADSVGLGSIEYAVEHIHSTVLVVLGHQKCGAVTAACSGGRMPSRNLDAIIDKILPAVGQAKGEPTPGGLVEAAVTENVHQSARDVLANSEILREAVRTGKLTVIEAEYQLDTGEVVRLNPPPNAQNNPSPDSIFPS